MSAPAPATGQDGHRVGPWIQAASGVAVDLDDVLPQQVNLDDIAGALSNLCRWTGHVRKFYSVAEHSVLVANLVSHMIPDGDDPHPYMRAALMHDAHEAYVGDVSSPLKVLLPQLKTIQRDIQRVIDGVFDLIPTPRIVVQADLMALALERRYLMGPCQRDWGWSPPEPVVDIEPLCLRPDEAFEQFMSFATQWGVGVPR